MSRAIVFVDLIVVLTVLIIAAQVILVTREKFFNKKGGKNE